MTLSKELGDGAEDNDGLDLIVRVNYKNKNGDPRSLDVKFQAEHLMAYGQNYSTGCLWATVNGLDKVSDVTFTAILSNGAVEISGSTAAYN